MRLDEAALAVRAALDVYDAEKATQAAEAYLDDLSNWYVRRSRRRFWKSEADEDKNAAYATLHHVLVEFVKLLAPFIPFTTEEMYQNLVCAVDESAPKSVHHTLYPNPDAATLDQRLLDKMQLAITAAGLGRAARSSVDIKLRQPLAAARINVGSQAAQEDLVELTAVLQEEINVKQVIVVSEVGELVNYKLMPNNRLLGPRFGKQFGAVRGALNALNPAEAARILQAGESLVLQVGGEEVSLSSEEVLVQTESQGGSAIASSKGVTVAIDIALTPELTQEGYARDIVRHLNNMRKEGGMEISDRVNVVWSAEGDVAAAFAAFGDYIQQETLALSLQADSAEADWYSQEVTVGGQTVTLAISKA